MLAQTRHDGADRPAARLFPAPIFELVLNGITVAARSSAPGMDLQEALQFAGDGKVRATTATARLDDINDVFARMHAGKIEGRIVLDMNA